MREDLIWGSKIQNWLLSLAFLAGMALLLGSVGWLFAGKTGFFFAIVMVGATLILAPAVNAAWTMKIMGAQPLYYGQAPILHEIVAGLARKAGFDRTPRLFYIASPDLNAFAAGSPKEAGIALTDGLLRYLDNHELTGVLAHELSHLRNKDTFVMNVAGVVNRMTRHLSFLGQILLLIYAPMLFLGGSSISLALILFLIGAPILSSMLQLALSRTREFRADLGAVELTGNPRGLASALQKLENVRQNPFWGFFWPRNRDQSPSWLRSHPASEARIRRLLSYEKETYSPEPNVRKHRGRSTRPTDGFANSTEIFYPDRGRIMRIPRQSPRIRYLIRPNI